MSLRREFVELATQEDANRRELCRRFGVSPKTAYKWLARFEQDGAAGLMERSRRPRSSPGRTVPALEAAVVALRMQRLPGYARADGARRAPTGMKNLRLDQHPQIFQGYFLRIFFMALSPRR